MRTTLFQPQARRAVVYINQATQNTAPSFQPGKVRFGSRFLGDDSVSVGTWIRRAVRVGSVLAVGIGSFLGLSNTVSKNNPGTVSVLVHQIGSGTERDAEGKCIVRGGGFLFHSPFTENYQYQMTPAQVRDTFTPLSFDGVPIDGDGVNIKDGIDVRITFRLDSGTADPNVQAQVDHNGNVVITPALRDSICNVHTRLLGASAYNDQYKNETGEAEHSTEFQSGNGTMQNLYYSQVLPVVQNALRILVPNIKAEDIHSQREFITNGLNNGWIQYKLDQNGNPVLDKEGNPIIVREVKPIAEQLAPLGIKVDYIAITDTDMPTFLKDKINERAQIPQETTNYRLKKDQYIAQQESARTAVGIENQKLLEEKRGDMNAKKAEAQGALDQAKQTALEKEQQAIGYRNQKIAEANGQARVLISQAEQEKGRLLEQARGLAGSQVTLAEGEAAKIRTEGEAQGEALALKGQMYTQYPELYTKLVAETNAEIRVALAERFGFVLVSPDTPVDGIITQIGDQKFAPLDHPAVNPALNEGSVGE